MVFANRRDAGRKLVARLGHREAEHPVVCAIPRGGLPVAVEIARALKAPLDLLAVRKLGAPQNPEFAIGAVAEDGTVVIDAQTMSRIGMTEAEYDRTLARERHELDRRVQRYRGGRPPLDVKGRTVILVDDGLATGLTDLAAVRALRHRGAGHIVVAVPVGSEEAVALLGDEADEVVCATIPRSLLSVGRWYEDFSPVSDDEVLAFLADAGTPPASPAGMPSSGPRSHALTFDLGRARLEGDLVVPDEARGLVVFAHGSGSSRRSVRNRSVARLLNAAGFATLLFDLLTDDESRRRELVFDIPLLAGRLEAVVRQATRDPAAAGLPVGLFGASTGAAAALRAAAALGEVVRAVVSRGGRPDLAVDSLAEVGAATLLIVGGRDLEVLELNRRTFLHLRCTRQLEVVDGATHLFEEPGTLEAVARLAVDWFDTHLTATAPPREIDRA